MDFTGGFETKDIIFSKRENGEIESGGFNIDSIFMKLGVSPLHTLINENMSKKLIDKNSEEKVSSLLFSGLAVPIGLLSEKPSSKSKKKQLEDYEEDEFIDYGNNNFDDIDYIQDDLYERLLGMHDEVSQRKENTHKNKNMNTRKKLPVSKKKKQTRKQREKK